MAAGDVKKDYDVVGKEAPDNGCLFFENTGIMPRKGPAEMDGGTNKNVPFDTGNYKGKKDYNNLTSDS